MRGLAWMTCLVIMCTTIGVDVASAQQAPAGCSSEQGMNAAHTLRCRDGLMIVAEDGAKFTLQSHDKSGDVVAVDLQSKAVLVDAPRQQGKTPLQGHHATGHRRGARDQMGGRRPATRTSVLVLRGQVAVRRPSGGGEVVLGPAKASTSNRGPTRWWSSAGRNRVSTRCWRDSANDIGQSIRRDRQDASRSWLRWCCAMLWALALGYRALCAATSGFSIVPRAR